MTGDHLFFDLDGTLTDSSRGITRSIVHALTALGRPAPSEAELIWCVGPPLLQSLRTLLGDDLLAQQALALYRQRFADVGLFENAVYPGVKELLAQLRDAGHQLHVATSKPQVFARRIVDHFDLGGYFQHIFGAELDGRLGDKPDLLAHALDVTGANPATSIMIGDRHHDAAGARANGMRSIGVLYGYGSREELTAAGVRWLASAPDAIAALVAQVRAAGPAGTVAR